MGTIGAWKARQIVENVSRVIAIEMISAAQGLDFIHLSSSPAVEKVRAALRAEVPFLEHDRSMSADIDKVARMVLKGTFVRAAKSACRFRGT